FDADLGRLVERMKALMEDAHGVGLAATQVGVLQRLFVLKPGEDEARALVNPAIVSTSNETAVDDEGCLSLQGVLVPVERHLKVTPPPAKATAERLGIPVLQPHRPEHPGTDIVVVAAYGLLIPEELLARGLWLNVHPSLLPRWRGAAPVERALMAGDEQTGVTIHRTVKELDGGPIAAQQAFAIAPEDDAGAVYERASGVAVQLLDDVLAREPAFRAQPEEGVTYAEKIRFGDRQLDLTQPARDLVNVVRGLSPHIGARATLQGRPVTVWKARVADDGSFDPLE